MASLIQELFGSNELTAGASSSMIPSDYPQNTFTRLACLNPKTGQTAVAYQLPLPTQMTYQSAFSWSTDTVPVAAQTMIDGYEKKSDINDIGGSFIKFGSTLWDSMKQSSGALGHMAVQTASQTLTGGTGAGKYFLKEVFGITYNPNKQLFFDGIDQTPLTLSFDIIPTSRAQSRRCAQSIAAIRTYASPKYSDTKTYFEYPNYFSAAVYVNGKVVLEYSKFAITNIATNLTPQGVMSWHDDGKPVSYTLEIQGIEAVMPTRDVTGARQFLGEKGTSSATY